MADKSMKGYSKPENADARFSPGASIGQTIAIGQPDTGNPWKDPEPVAPHGSGQTHPKMPFARPPNKQVTRGGPGSGPRKGGMTDQTFKGYKQTAKGAKTYKAYIDARKKDDAKAGGPGAGSPGTKSGKLLDKMNKEHAKFAKGRTDFGGEVRGGPGSGPRKGGEKDGGQAIKDRLTAGTKALKKGDRVTLPGGHSNGSWSHGTVTGTSKSGVTVKHDEVPGTANIKAKYPHGSNIHKI